MKNKQVTNDLFDYKDMKIIQDEKLFKFSLDSILLAEFVDKPKKNYKILDMCTGNAPVPLILSTKCKNDIYGFEIQDYVYKMALKSIEINKKANQIKIINDNIKNIKNYFPGNNFNIITCNPPYFKISNNSLINENIQKAIARHEIKINLSQIISLASLNLDNKGEFYLVHRAERIAEIINLCIINKLAVKKLQFISTKEGDDPYLVLIKAVKNGGNGVKVARTICINNCKTYQNIFKKE